MRRKNPSVLCFTTSYKRPYNLYHCTNSILNQSHSSFDYAIGLSVDTPREQHEYEYLLSDYSKDKRLKILFHPNFSQHENYLYPIKKADYEKYDIFIKIDDDDIYKKTYIENMLNHYKKSQKDVLSGYITYQLNNNKLYKGKFDNVGGHWHEDLKSDIQFGMPFTYIFNRKALNVLLNTTSSELSKIHIFEDAGWRKKWRDNHITSKVLDNIDYAIYNIHGNNISSKHCFIPDNEGKIYISQDEFDIAYFIHYGWESYCFIDTKRHKIFNIENNHYGKFDLNKKIITINWENYGKEVFKLDNNKIYRYIQ